VSELIGTVLGAGRYGIDREVASTQMITSLEAGHCLEAHIVLYLR